MVTDSRPEGHEVRTSRSALFLVAARRCAGYEQCDSEAAKLILQDPRLVWGSPLLVGWAQSTMDRPPWIALTAKDEKSTVEAAEFVLEDPRRVDARRVHDYKVLVTWAGTVVYRSPKVSL
jgi:hypothetical protein